MTFKIIAITTIVFFSFSSCGIEDFREWEEAKKSNSVYKADTLRKQIRAVLGDTTFVWVNRSYHIFPYKKYCANEVVATFDARDSIVLQFLRQDSLSIANLLTSKFQSQGISLFIGQTLDRFQLNVYLYTEDHLNPIGTLFDLPIPNSGKLKEDKEWKSYKYLSGTP
ncbi:MAG TPA: hypothetical protein VD908_19825 [Cytophagales bacterium]|nr:hypothetical protein [Cytophagales bacterium]